MINREEVFSFPTNPEGWQKGAGGRSIAKTPGSRLDVSLHPGGMPEIRDPSKPMENLSRISPSRVARASSHPSPRAFGC